MRLVSWNVNGIRACLGKGFMEFFDNADADIFCIQETRFNKDKSSLTLMGIISIELCCEKGYSGTALFQSKAVIRCGWNWNK